MFAIKYQHNYFKKDEKKHTTIRGLTWYKNGKVKVGELVEEQFPSQTNISKVIDIWTEKLENLSLEFLKEDGEYPGFTINNHEDFCKLINSFLLGFYYQATPQSTKTVIILEVQESNTD